MTRRQSEINVARIIAAHTIILSSVGIVHEVPLHCLGPDGQTIRSLNLTDADSVATAATRVARVLFRSSCASAKARARRWRASGIGISARSTGRRCGRCCSARCGIRDCPRSARAMTAEAGDAGYRGGPGMARRSRRRFSRRLRCRCLDQSQPLGVITAAENGLPPCTLVRDTSAPSSRSRSRTSPRRASQARARAWWRRSHSGDRGRAGR